jgi:stage 0 sporulation regulatory protein
MNEQMLEEIQKIRVKMIDSAEKNGLTNELTIHYSQELDQLIYQYQRFNQRRPKEKKEIRFVFNKMVLVWPKSLLAGFNLLH